jgi:lysyl-tRNA synthetase class 1
MNMKKNRYKSWPFKEASRLIGSFGKNPLPDQVLFQTGYGPSGLPHIGTFAEVARTTWIMNAYGKLSGKEAKLIAFSDDLDGLRKVPANLPAREMLSEHLGKPLSDIPDPYGCCDSFSGHMISKLKEFLDAFGFKYELRSASKAYRDGDFNEGLKILLERVDDVLALILPTLKEENRAGWSPFLPKCEKCGKIYTTKVTAYNKSDLSVDYSCNATFGDVVGCGHKGTASVLNGGAKMGWKVDWALRWFSYGINYEMYGKDLIPSAELSKKIIKIMGGRAPVGFFYELFLDENGEKISKSIGNGVSMEQWLRYAPVESLSYFIFREPRQAKKLYIDMIPRTMDEYLDNLKRYPDIADEKKPDSAIWHIHNAGKEVPLYNSSINFTMINNLVSALGMAKPDNEKIASFLTRYDENILKYSDVTNTLIEKGVAYYIDRILPGKVYRAATSKEKEMFLSLKDKLEAKGAEEMSQKEIQSLMFDIAKEAGEDPKNFFSAFYQVLLGQKQGPRFGSFAKLVGLTRVIELINEKI